MTRGCRVGFVPKGTLVERLNRCNACRSVSLDEQQQWSIQKVLGHASFYGLVSNDEFYETVPRTETTIPCYLLPLLEHSAPPGSSDAIDKYVVAASKMYHRGSMIANYVAMRLYGPRVMDPVQRAAQRFDKRQALEDARPYLRFIKPSDVRNSALKQVFLPERWPTPTVRRDPFVQWALENKGHVLPSEPDGWKELMGASGWDNSLNRMASKLSANVQVHCRANLVKRVANWIGSTVSLCGGETVPALGETLESKLRPLTVHDDDWALLMDLRNMLGANVEEPVYPPPKMAPFNDEVLALHMFVVRYGANESAYMPVIRRGRKFMYLDAKIARALLKTTHRQGTKNKKRKTRKVGSSPRGGNDGNDETDEQATGEGEGGEGGEGEGGEGDDDDVASSSSNASESLGSLLGLHPKAFNALRKRLRKRLQQELKTPKRPGGRLSPSRRKSRKKRMRLGAGHMHSKAMIQSLETDGVGARLCVKTPINMSTWIVPLEEREESNSVDPSSSSSQPQAKPRKKRLKRDEYRAYMAAKSQEEEAERKELYARRANAPTPVHIGVDNGRKKLSVSAVSTNPAKKPYTEVFTRSKYYSEMRYWRHRSWSLARSRQPHVREANEEMSRAGGLRNCDPFVWDAALAAEKVYADVLDDEYVESKDYALWRMRMFRLKRGSIDRATFGLMKRALKGQPANRGLVLGIGNGSFCSTGKGELSAPTRSLDRAFRRSVRRMQESPENRHRSIEVESIEEYGTTMCCCSCGELTTRPFVNAIDKETGETRRMPSRRMRLCTKCDSTAGMLRDRDVQGARNMLWILQLTYVGGDRPYYMTRKGRREMSMHAGG